MGLEAAVTNLVETLKALTASVEEVQFCAVEDRPKRGDSVLIDLVDSAAEDLKAQVRHARLAAKRMRKALGPPLDLERLRHSLGACQHSHTAAAQRFAAEMHCYDRIADLKRLGRERGGEWKGWATELVRAVEHCEAPLGAVGQALVDCWQEVAERAGAGSVAVRTTSIGAIHMTPPERRTPSSVPDAP
jgi:hypothetical protein